MLSVGIVGLPNVGKSTLFNALTSGHANVSNYPFTTIDSNIGVVPVPDHRLAELERILDPIKTTPCTIQFVDIAGLVKGASQGEGLGNQFLGEIRSVDAVAHVLRLFVESDVAHVHGDVDPVRDAEVVETELLLADLDVLERAIEKRRRVWSTEPRAHADEQRRWLRYRDELAEGQPLRSLDLSDRDRAELKALGLITGKPLLFVVNVSEEEYGGAEPPAVAALRHAVGEGAPVVVFSAKFEWELQQLEPEDRAEFLRDLGLGATGIARLAEVSFELLGLIRFYTVVKEKLQAWELRRGLRAPQAAGEVHSDMERGFIRARVVSFEDLQRSGSLQELHRLGLIRTEGKEYQVQDGDVMEFLFQG
jgi:GTP-binding protein YchF